MGILGNRYSHAEVAAAGEFVGTVWSAIEAAGGLTAPPLTHSYFHKALEEEWMNDHPLPLADSKVVTLANGDDFQRMSPSKAAEAYKELPRTKIYGEFNTGWLGLAGQYLMMRAGCQIIFNAYESLPGDKTMYPHTDDVPVFAVQLYGKKAWWLGDQACEERGEPTLIMRPGDGLFIPMGYPHDVSTLAEIGSLHLSMGAALDDKPLPLL